MPNTTHVIGHAWIAPRQRDRTVFRSIYLHGSFQPLSSNSKCNACPPCWAMPWAIRCAPAWWSRPCSGSGRVCSILPWPISPVLFPADRLHWVDHPLFDYELTALHNCLIARRLLVPLTGSRNSREWLVWTRRFAHVAGLARHRIRALAPFVFQRLTDSH